MEARKPDLKAPRAKIDAGYCPINVTYWRKFKRETGVDCTYREFSDTIKMGNDIILSTIINERDGFKLLNNIGTLMLVSCMPPKDKENIDYGKLNKDGVRVPHYNWETDGKICKILYTTYQVRNVFVNRKLWSFEGVRDLTRGSSAKFRTQHEIYKSTMYFENATTVLKNEKKIVRDIDQEIDYFKDE